MKITKETLTKIIKEEMENILQEQVDKEPTPDQLKNLPKDTLAGATAAGTGHLKDMDTLAGATAAQDEPPQEMARKYEKVKQILAKLVSEL